MSILEIIISAAIIMTAIVGISGAWQLYLKVSGVSAQKTQAAILIEEAGEAITIMRDQSWTGKILPLGIGTDYYLYWNAGAYATTTTATTTSGLTRKIVFSQIFRDAQSDISTSGGTLDLNTRKVTIRIYAATTSDPLVQAEMLLHNAYSN